MKIILTGATGYVGEGTLLELLKCNAVWKVLSVSRKPTGIKLFLPFYPVLRLLGHANNMREIALSQIVLARDGFEKFAVSPKDISSLAKKFENSI